MVIIEYDEVDPLGVLSLAINSLDFALTPERAAKIRRLDRRPFPCLAVYAQEQDAVAGQVGVFRLPVETINGPEDVGGVWAVSVQPAYRRRGFATQLMKEAHARMRAAGLRFSTLGTRRSLVAHRMYRQLGYEDVHVATESIAESKRVKTETSLKAKLAGNQDLDLADSLYEELAPGHLGFARRQPNFISMLSEIGSLYGDIWLIWDGDAVTGYALTQQSYQILTISNFLLGPGINPVDAISAIPREVDVQYHRVRIDDRSQERLFTEAGYRAPLPMYSAFMIKALDPGVSVSDAIRLLGIGSDRFMISPMDIT